MSAHQIRMVGLPGVRLSTWAQLMTGLQWIFVVFIGVLGTFVPVNLLNNIAFAVCLAAIPLYFMSSGKLSTDISIILCVSVLFHVVVIIVNGFDAQEAVIALRYYAAMPVLFMMIVSRSQVTTEEFVKVMSYWPVILMIQVGFCVFQYMSFVPGLGGWDAVVGTFGGNREAGGNSGGLAIFLLLCLSYVAACTLCNTMKATKGLLYGAALFVTAALAEIKIVIALAPVVVVVAAIISGKISIKGIILIGLMCVVFPPVLIKIYSVMFYQGLYGSPSEFLIYVMPELSGEQLINWDTREVGRLTALQIWWQQNRDLPFQLLFGNGHLSVRQASQFLGMGGAGRFPFDPGVSALAFWLWDLGIVGVVLMTTAVGYGMRCCIAGYRRATVAMIRAAYLTSGVALFVCMLMTAYSRTLSDTIQSQWLFGVLMSVALTQSVYFARPSTKPILTGKPS